MRRTVLAAVLLAAGCSGAADLPAPVVRPEVRPGLMLPPARAETEVELRTFVTEAGLIREVAGARCRLDSDAFTAAFTSPARLALPDLGQAAPVLAIVCTDGTRSGSADLRATLRGGRASGGWPAVGVSVGTGGRDVGVSIGALWGGQGWGAREPLLARAVYPDVRIELR